MMPLPPRISYNGVLKSCYPFWIETTGGRSVCFSALHVDVPRQVHHRPGRSTRWRRWQPAARLVRHCERGDRPTGPDGRAIDRRHVEAVTPAYYTARVV